MVIHIALTLQSTPARFSVMGLGLSTTPQAQADLRLFTAPSLPDFIARNLALSMISQLVLTKKLCTYTRLTDTEQRKY